MQKIQSENKYAPPMRSKKKIGNTTFIVNSFSLKREIRR